MRFCTVMCEDKGKDGRIKDYFKHANYYNFVSNNVNNEHWFCDRNIIHNYFVEVIQELAQMKSELNAKKDQSSL